MRWIRHLLSRVNRHFPPATMDAIRDAIANSERRQLGEIVFAVEGRLSFTDLWHGRQARDCAIEAFSKLRVWDTEGNSGVLIYLLLADHAIEIVADRGIARHVPDSDWQAVCGDMRQRLAGGDFEGDPGGGHLRIYGHPQHAWGALAVEVGARRFVQERFPAG